MFIEKLTKDDYKKLVKIILPTAIDFDIQNQFGEYFLNVAEITKVLNFSISDYSVDPINKSAKNWLEKFPINDLYFKFMKEKFGKTYENKYHNNKNSLIL